MKNNTAIILLLLSVGLFYTFTNGQYKEVKRLRAVAAEFRSVLDNASRIAELRDQLLLTYETFPRAEIDRLNKVLPDNIDTVRLALDLDGMASRYGISIRNIQTSTDASIGSNQIILPEFSNTYEKATVSFAFIASYDNFMRLLADIERSLRIMDVKTMTFLTSESGLYEYHVAVDTYWLR